MKIIILFSLIILLFCVGCRKEEIQDQETLIVNSSYEHPLGIFLDIGQPKSKLIIKGNGKVKVLPPQKTITIPIDEFNKICNGKWKLLDVYYKNSCRTSLWMNEETFEKKEVIGISPPSEKLTIRQE